MARPSQGILTGAEGRFRPRGHMLPGMRRGAMFITAAALLLSACGGGNAVEATVNGTDITTADVEGLLFEVTDGDRTPEQFAVYLGLLIQWTAIDDRVASELAYYPTEDEIDTQVRTIVLNAGFTELPTFLSQQNISESTLRRIATQLLLEQELRDMFAEPVGEPTDAEVEAAAAERPWFSEVCASHIQTTTVDEAAFAMSRLRDGDAFADVAAELSTDANTAPIGGSLGCTDPRVFPAEFADALSVTPVGEVGGPVQSDLGWHLILVQSKTVATTEEVRQALLDERQATADAAAAEAVSTWLDDAVRAATVTVNEQRGTWVTDPEPLLLPPAQLG
jgi:PPIC-type PPIASE domain